jgi:hypothetical protein
MMLTANPSLAIMSVGPAADVGAVDVLEVGDDGPAGNELGASSLVEWSSMVDRLESGADSLAVLCASGSADDETGPDVGATDTEACTDATAAWLGSALPAICWQAEPNRATDAARASQVKILRRPVKCIAPFLRARPRWPRGPRNRSAPVELDQTVRQQHASCGSVPDKRCPRVDEAGQTAPDW